MERIEKVLLLAVLGVALMIVAVMSFLPEGVDPGKRGSPLAAAAGGGRGEVAAAKEPAGAPEGERAKQPDQRSIEDLIGLGAANPGEVGPKTLTAPPAEDAKGSEPAKGEGGAATPPGAPPASEPPRAPESESKVDPRARVAFQYAPNPDYLEYVVQPGDSLHRIVQQVCGTTSSLDEVLKVNESLRLNPNLVREGFRLLIPKSAVVEASARRPAETTPAASQAPAPPASAPANAPASAKPVTSSFYTVQSGDTLWKIAVSRRGKKAAQAYVAQIQEENPLARGTLHPGMKLRLP